VRTGAETHFSYRQVQQLLGIFNDAKGEPSASIRERVEVARAQQTERFKDVDAIYANGDMAAGDIQTYCVLKEDAKQLLNLSVRKMRLSARSYHRVLKLSRTIADLAGADEIEVPHVAEAIQYRPQQDT
ncbi:MAG: hypothetical protein AAFQ07_04430, partial [Chloroflexota bacterium]